MSATGDAEKPDAVEQPPPEAPPAEQPAEKPAKEKKPKAPKEKKPKAPKTAAHPPYFEVLCHSPILDVIYWDFFLVVEKCYDGVNLIKHFFKIIFI